MSRAHLRNEALETKIVLTGAVCALGTSLHALRSRIQPAFRIGVAAREGPGWMGSETELAPRGREELKSEPTSLVLVDTRC